MTPALIRIIIVSLTVAFLTFQNAMGQEPVVVTEVKSPAITEKKTETSPAKGTGAYPSRDTTAATENSNTGFLENITSDSIPAIGYDKISAGFGMGLDYGGFGANILMYPQKNIGLFFGLGYNMVKVGVNGGIKARILPGGSSNKIGLSALAMYGYNASISIKDYSDLNRVFYGFSLGIGIDYRPLSSSAGSLFMGIYVPFRKPEVQDYIEELENMGFVFEKKLSPVLVGIGYRITIR